MRSAQAIEELVGLELPGTLGRGHIGEGDADITGYFLQLTRIGNRLVNLLGRAQATAVFRQRRGDLHKIGRGVVHDAAVAPWLLGNDVPVGFFGSCGCIVEFEGLGVCS